jgi:hypothetical protein
MSVAPRSLVAFSGPVLLPDRDPLVRGAGGSSRIVDIIAGMGRAISWNSKE